jgi:hypothetical protein
VVARERAQPLEDLLLGPGAVPASARSAAHSAPDQVPSTLVTVRQWNAPQPCPEERGNSKAMLADAYENELVGVDASRVRVVVPDRGRPRKPAQKRLAHDQTARIFAAIPARYRLLFLLLAYTGLRISEALRSASRLGAGRSQTRPWWPSGVAARRPCRGGDGALCGSPRTSSRDPRRRAQLLAAIGLLAWPGVHVLLTCAQ